MKESSTVARRLHILKILDQKERVDVHGLSSRFRVSEVAIRKDLRYFEQKNLLIRSRGGALKQGMVHSDMPVFDRRRQNTKQKELIGKVSSRFIRNGDTVLLDSGTTVMKLAAHISREAEITVITNAVDIAFRLADYPKIRLMMPGGILRRNSLSLVGEQAAQALRNFHCDVCFAGADGIDRKRGLLTMNVEEAHLSRISMENAGESWPLSP